MECPKNRANLCFTGEQFEAKGANIELNRLVDIGDRFQIGSHYEDGVALFKQVTVVDESMSQFGLKVVSVSVVIFRVKIGKHLI